MYVIIGFELLILFIAMVGMLAVNYEYGSKIQKYKRRIRNVFFNIEILGNLLFFGIYFIIKGG